MLLFITWGLSRCGLAAQQCEHFACDIARIGFRSEEDVGRCYLFRLSGSLYGRVCAEFRNLFRWLIRWIKRRPDGAGRNTVDANLSLDKTLRQRFCESVYGSLG